MDFGETTNEKLTEQSDPKPEEKSFYDKVLEERTQPDLKEENGKSPLHSMIKMSETPVRQDLPPPMLGQHTQQVIDEWLG